MNSKSANPKTIENEEVNKVAGELSITKYHAARILKKTVKAFGHVWSIEENLNLRNQLPAIIKIIFEEVQHSQKPVFPKNTLHDDRHDIIENRIQIKECGFSIKSFF